MTNKKKVIIGVSSGVAVLLIAVIVALLICGSKWGIPPFGFLRDNRLKNLEGNGEKYAVENVQPKENSPLDGYNVVYLGSSVTNGASSINTSFVEYIAKRNNTTFIKEAVNGTTLADGKNSYIERMKKIDKTAKVDLFVCQLSTNDATKNKPLGTASKTDNPETNTVCGAIEYIIGYARETWNCPIVFYTNTFYENANYSAMVTALKEIGELYDIGVIDLYTDAAFNDITAEQKKLYMEDNIHPTKAGYLEWWTPKMEQYLCDYIGE